MAFSTFTVLCNHHVYIFITAVESLPFQILSISIPHILSFFLPQVFFFFFFFLGLHLCHMEVHRLGV